MELLAVVGLLSLSTVAAGEKNAYSTGFGGIIVYLDVHEALFTLSFHNFYLFIPLFRCLMKKVVLLRLQKGKKVAINRFKL